MMNSFMCNISLGGGGGGEETLTLGGGGVGKPSVPTHICIYPGRLSFFSSSFFLNCLQGVAQHSSP